MNQILLLCNRLSDSALRCTSAKALNELQIHIGIQYSRFVKVNGVEAPRVLYSAQ